MHLINRNIAFALLACFCYFQLSLGSLLVTLPSSSDSDSAGDWPWPDGVSVWSASLDDEAPVLVRVGVGVRAGVGDTIPDGRGHGQMTETVQTTTGAGAGTARPVPDDTKFNVTRVDSVCSSSSSSAGINGSDMERDKTGCTGHDVVHRHYFIGYVNAWVSTYSLSLLFCSFLTLFYFILACHFFSFFLPGPKNKGNKRREKKMEILLLNRVMTQNSCPPLLVPARNVYMWYAKSAFWFVCNYQYRAYNCSQKDMEISLHRLRDHCGEDRSGFDFLSKPGVSWGVENIGHTVC